MGTRKAEALIIVPVVRIVVVTIGRTTVFCIVVPATATINTIRTLQPTPLMQI